METGTHAELLARGRRSTRGCGACSSSRTSSRVPCVDDDEVLGRAFDRRLMRAALGGGAAAPPAAGPVARALPARRGALELLAALSPQGRHRRPHPRARTGSGSARIAALFAVSLVVLYGLRVAQAYLTQLTGQRVIHDLRAALFAHLQSLDARFFDRNPVGRLMTRVLNDVEAINELFTSGVVAIVGDVVTLAGVVVIMLWHGLAARARDVRARARARRAAACTSASARATPTARCAAGWPGSTPSCRSRSRDDGDPALRARGERAARPSAGSTRICRRAQFRLHRSTRPRSTRRWRRWARWRVALLLWYGGGEIVRGRADLRRARGLHRVHGPLLPAASATSAPSTR